MKAILMSIRPQWVVKILNGEKTIEIRKKFPKDYVGWVYIYCCKQRKNEIGCHINYKKVDGKVVARFWCDKVEEIDHWFSIMPCFKQTCLSQLEFADYIGSEIGYAIHISKLEIFNEPKDISEFLVYSHTIDGVNEQNKPQKYKVLKHLARAPQSWCYIEV